ncbi:glycosyltransferase [Candidatus Bathyarchaeota archaeon]|nr:glycosyltransferase [Candidatus Bathyarchaeota archaeon]
MNWDPEQSSISIGICAYNEEKNIGSLLENLLCKQNLPERSEIIVACSGCTDRTPEIVEGFMRKDKRVRLILERERTGKAPALNRILSIYDGKIFVHLDADHIPEPGALGLLLKHFRDPEVGAVSGHQIPVQLDSFMGKICRVIWGLHNETQSYYDRKGEAQHLGGVLFAIKRGVCDRVPEDIVNDDAYMGVVCRARRYKVAFEKNAVAAFRGPETVFDYVNQRRRVVYGHLRVKKETTISPMVLEASPLRDKVLILSRWLKENWRLAHYLLAAVFLEAVVNVMARFDLAKKKNIHKVWKIATTTKNKL